MIAISTCWNSGRHTSGAEMLGELRDLGFRHVELGHGIRMSLMDGILSFQEKEPLTITSLHNFCPLPVEVLQASPDCYQFSSHRPWERERAVKLTRQTIDYACRLGAPRVVLHCGRIASMNSTRPLRRMVREGGLHSRKFVQAKLAAVREREKAAGHYLQRVRELLLPLAEYAAEKGVVLGLENRDRYEAMPTEREAAALVEELWPRAGYWHDFGHAQVKENQGFLDHAAWLAEIGPRCLGCHLHDTAWPDEDHLPPFEGAIDFEKLVPLLPRDCLFVLEMHPSVKADALVRAAEAWQEKFGA